MKTNKKEKLRTKKRERPKGDSIDKLIVDKSLNSDETFFNYFKVTPKQYEHLLSLIETRIKKKDANLEEWITTKDRLALTLRYLSGSDLIKEISTSFQVRKSAVPGIVIEMCEAITEVLQPLVMPKPSTEKWLEITKDFQKFWFIPHCVGAIDIKHFEMEVSSGMGWTRYNRKGVYALTLLAVADSDSHFIIVDVGAPGHLYDKVILENSNIGHQMQEGLLSLPSPELIPKTTITMPYSFIGDEGFPLQVNLMKPYPGSNLTNGERIFNTKLSEARQCIEKAFGMMAAHFRIFRSPMSVQVETAVAAVEAATCLHNYLMLSEDSVPAHKKLYGTPKVTEPHKLIKKENTAGTCDGNSGVKAKRLKNTL